MQHILLIVMAYDFGGIIFWVSTSSSCLFQPLEDLIGFAFIPKLFNWDVTFLDKSNVIYFLCLFN